MDQHDPQYASIAAFVDELVRAGVAHACVSPGARSTPLTLALAAHPGLRAWSHVDERSGGFFGLGVARLTRRPVAIVCTSGTAAANFLPAVIEAAYAHVPLLVLTADRPPELRDCGAGQTIDQIKLYGAHVKWFAEVGTSEAGARYFRALACHAVTVAAANPPGPVHLNVPLREPLVPVPPPPGASVAAAPSPRADAPYTVVHEGVAVPVEPTLDRLAGALAATPRGVIVCGPADTNAPTAAAVTALAARLGYPILADPLSQLRTGTHETRLIVGHYDALLRDETFVGRMAPDLVLRIGPLPTSKALLQLIQRRPPQRHLVIDPLGTWNDPTLTATDILRVDPAAACSGLLRRLPAAPPHADWCAEWLAGEQRVRAAFAARLAGMTELFEGKVFTELAALLPAEAAVFVGNSMPVRDCETFWPVSSRPVRFLCNRGANGIDGFVSAGLGAAAASPTPLVMVTGDLGFLHDLNGLLAAKRYGIRATIIVLNNDGGGIFAFLPQAECGAAFEEFFLTPHGLDFRGAAEMYDCAFARIASWEQFRTAVTAALRAERTTVIEVPLARTRNVVLHRELWALAGGPGA